MELSQAVVVVTGAARGIGRAIAEGFAARGSCVALVDVLGEQVSRTAAELQATGATTLAVATDITKADQVEAMAVRVEDGLGSAKILVNCAGTFSVVAPVWEADPERWFRDIRVNLYGTFLCCRSFSRLMVARRSGYIINVLGGGISDPHPYSTSYASSKTGLMRLTEGLAAETREHGVKVFALAPPAVLTDMTRFIMEDPEARRWRPEFRDIFANRWDHPPGVVAEMAINLMSGRADALTGRCFDATADFDAIIAQSPDILEKDRLTLRVRR